MKLTFLLLVLTLAPSCASIINGNHDTITVNSLEKGTTIFVDNVARGTDSIACEVKRGHPHTIRVEKDGFQSTSIETDESFDATSLLGILIDFGIISIPIDMISGSAWKTDPRMYTVTPLHPASTPAAPAPAPIASH